jgi:WhiB family redox-sensing transcriptional regulator
VRAHLFDWGVSACRDVDPELLFPIGDGPLTRRQIAEAKSVCGRCALTTECLDRALVARIPDDIWGGRTPEERSGWARATDHRTQTRGDLARSSSR